MEIIQIIGFSGALTVGLVLGIMGSGGSVIAIPIFAYLFHISPVTTTAYSLFVVGTSASIGALKHWRAGLVDFRIAFVFAIPAFMAIYVVRKYVLPIIPTELMVFKGLVVTKDMAIMVLLAVLMLFSAISMLRKSKLSSKGFLPNGYNYPMMIFQGILIGSFTGLVGIGGGFLIIPVLVLLVKLPIKKAVATSMFIIALKSLIGFMGDLGHLEINWSFLGTFTLISVLGTCLGIYLSTYINSALLKKIFGWMVLIIAMGILYKEVLT